MNIRRTFHSIILFLLLLSTFSCNKPNVYKKYYPDGSLEEKGEVRNGKFTGDYVYYSEKGIILAEGKFRNGHPIGIWYYYYSDGSIQSIQEYNKRGKTVVLDCWDQNGNQVVKNGTGTFIKYFPDGSIESNINYKDYKFDGLNEGWYSNGIKEHEFYYQDGKPVGTWRFWDMNGILYRTEEY